MAAQMARTIMLDKKLRQIDLSIGQNYKDIVTLEDNCNTLDLQISSWEPEIDAHSAEELSRITQEFKRELLQHKVVMKSLENAADEVDKAVNELYAGKDAVEGAIKISERYERLEREMAFAEQEEDKARRRYEMEQEQLKQKQEQEKEAQKLDQGMEENKMGRTLSYN
jgi:multidrug resistance efflux pump